MNLKLLVMVLFFLGVFAELAIADCPKGTLLAKRSFLDQDKKQARRLILEPGTVLKCNGVKGRRLEVQTPTGITGTISKKSVDIFSVDEFQLAYPITAFSSKSNNRNKWFYPGEFYPFKEDANGNYVLSIGVATYNLREKKYQASDYPFILPNEDLEKFNFIDQYIVRGINFPEWRKIETSGVSFEQQWGCGKSVSKRLAADARVEGSVSVEGGLLSWITAKFGFKTSADGEIEITQEKKDEKFLHTMTYWDLIDQNNQPLLTIAVERYHTCTRRSDEPINYKFHFPNNEFEEIILDQEWSRRYEFKDGGAVPIRLSGIDDFFKFSSKLSDHYNLSGEYADAIRDFTIFSAVNIR